MSEYVTRGEHQTTVARLDAADAELRKSIVDTERVLRGEFVAAVKDVREDVSDVRNYNVKQTKLIIGAVAAIFGVAASVLSILSHLHIIFG